MKYPYQDPSLTPEQRTEDLLSRMTLEEKLAQMRLIRFKPEQAQQVPFDLSLLEKFSHRIGAVYNASSMPEETVRAIQDWVKENTRLGIPVAFHGESLHGVMHEQATCFPQSVGLGATFNEELMGKIADHIGKEARAIGLTMTYAPNVDLSRDPRWGRVEENYGEDPYLTSRLGVAYVKALQAQGVAACPKHYIAHGSPEGGINLAPVHAGMREFRETLSVPFEKVVAEGGAMGIMPAYSEWDGVPVHGSEYLLTQLLRDEYGFEGVVVSDYGAIKMLHTFHKVAETPLEAGKMALRAGVDVEAPSPYGFTAELEEAVKNGQISEELVDRAVRRVLLHKFRMGLFENPYGHSLPDRAEELALQAAVESLVLLKNEGLLPLSDSVGKVALIGPDAAVPQLGGYTVRESFERAVTLKQAMEQRLGDRLVYEPGCTVASGTDEMLQKAVEAARNADVAVLALGDNSSFFGGIGWGDQGLDGKAAVTCGEGFDAHSLDLPGRQQELLEAVCATGTPVVLVLQTGRPYAICWAKENVPAILQAWYPGQQGGNAIAQVLFGDRDPGGRLPISFPRSVGHIPSFYNHKMSARGFYKNPGTKEEPGRDYVFDTPDALFPFGHGLSYTSFAYSDLQLPETAAVGETVSLSVTVENTGSRTGFETVQMYVTDRFCRITPFVKQLRGFKKLELAPGEKRTVTFSLGFEDFSFINESYKREVEPGKFTICVGNLQAEIELK